MAFPEAAKIVLTSPEGLIFPAGPSGRLNLPGGTIERGESPEVTLAREMEEEIGLSLSVVPRFIGSKSVSVTSKEGELESRRWHIFAGETDKPFDQLTAGDDIVGIHVVPHHEWHAHRGITQNAKVAIALANLSMRLPRLLR